MHLSIRFTTCVTAALCLSACLGLSNRSGAPFVSSDVDLSLMARCQFEAFRSTVEPVLQTRCVSCHGAGGSGSGKMKLNQGGSLSDVALVENYAASIGYLTYDATLNVESHPILARPRGEAHDTILNSTDADYAAMVNWVFQEVDGACDAPGNP